MINKIKFVEKTFDIVIKTIEMIFVCVPQCFFIELNGNIEGVQKCLFDSYNMARENDSQARHGVLAIGGSGNSKQRAKHVHFFNIKNLT